MEQMDEEELQQLQAEKAKMKAMFREDVGDDQYFPIIVKSNQAGTLETLMTEAQKIIGAHYQIQVIDSGVGPITEADI